MRLTHRVVLLAAIPLLGFAVQSFRILADASADRTLSARMEGRVATLGALSRLVHELQKERGISSLHVSGGVGLEPVERQRSESDLALESFREEMTKGWFNPEELAGPVGAADGLAGLRERVKTLGDAALVRREYSASIGDALSLYKAGILGPTSNGVGKCLTSLAILEDAKESTGQMRAFLSSLFAIDAPLTPAQRKQFFQLHARIEGSLRSPALALSKEGKEGLERIRDDSTAREVERMFLALIENGDRGGYGIDGKACFATMTRRIDQIDQIVRGENLSEQARIEAMVRRARTSWWWSTILLVVLSGLLVGLTLWIQRDISRGFGVLGKAVRDIAGGCLSTTRSDRTDEIGEILLDLGRTSSTLDALVQQMRRMSDEHTRGEIDAQIDPSKFQGAFADMGRGINEMVFGHIAVKKKAMACVGEFGRGNFDAPLEKFPGKKAFINDTIEKVRENLKGVNEDTIMLVKAALEGRLATRADATKHQGDFRKIIQGINDTLDAVINPVNEAALVLEKVAARDMTVRVMGNYQGDLGRIKLAVNTAVENLDKALGQVSQATLQVSSAAQQISAGSQSLAQGANEQASSLEEVSSSLEEMASMTRQNADNALQAKNLAGEADGNAKQGSEAMSRMDTAIVKIKDSSDQTAKIVKTIDEIAMQTNLLALNAAVEAARAGEAGRGFAVVAEEVRNLAQRSAQAAKSTADMIGESVKNADEGVKIAREVAKSFESIAVSSRKVNDLISEIASASKEQSQGIEQVNAAVSQMDKVTQQTAANAEESASSSEELSSQAEELQSMVAQFQISQEIGASRATPALGGRGHAVALGGG
jgi:methyl-accepting chemotaxis protein